MIAQILRELIAAGLQGESLVAAVERIEQAQPKAVDATAERRRAKDRERHRLRNPPKSTETAESTVSTEPHNEALSSLLTSSENTSIKQESKKERATAPRKIAIPDDWTPKPVHYAKAAEFQYPEKFVDQQAHAMRNWAKSKGIRRVDWDATFHGFIKPKENNHGFGGPRPLQDDSKSISRAAARLAEKAERGEFSFGPRPSLLPQPDDDNVRLLSKR